MNDVMTVNEAGQGPDVISQMVAAFEAAAQFDEESGEFWTGRDLQGLLSYSKWDNFIEVVEKAKASCRSANIPPADHFADVRKMVPIGSGTDREIADLRLSRYACYLIAQNADSRKRPVAFAQTYFAIQTRRQELTDRDGVDFSSLSAVQQRLYLRNQVMEENKRLSSTAKLSGVKDGKDHAIFQTKGYQGLYGGRNVDDIRRHKRLPANAKILDHMGSTELAANLFRITQTEEKLRSDNISSKDAANRAHYEVGRKVRETMKELSGILPEDLPVEEDVKKIGKAKTAKLAPPAPIPAPEPYPVEMSGPVEVDLRTDLWKYALLIMSVQPYGKITTRDLIDELPNYIQLSAAHERPNASRKDSKFSQLVRNLKSHRDCRTNFIYLGYAETIPNGFRITPKGVRFVREYFQDRIEE